jgi:hypothetical protein
MNYAMLRWWLLTCVSVIFQIILQHRGIFSIMWVADVSKISFIIIGLYFILTFFTGVITHRLNKENLSDEDRSTYIRYLDACWYSSELLMALGMMGTLIGFSLMLGSLVGLDFANIAATKTGIFSMAAGMGTAIYATLSGLIASQLLKIQLVSLEISLENEE